MHFRILFAFILYARAFIVFIEENICVTRALFCVRAYPFQCVCVCEITIFCFVKYDTLHAYVKKKPPPPHNRTTHIQIFCRTTCPINTNIFLENKFDNNVMMVVVVVTTSTRRGSIRNLSIYVRSFTYLSTLVYRAVIGVKMRGKHNVSPSRRRRRRHPFVTAKGYRCFKRRAMKGDECCMQSWEKYI